MLCQHCFFFGNLDLGGTLSNFQVQKARIPFTQREREETRGETPGGQRSRSKTARGRERGPSMVGGPAQKSLSCLCDKKLFISGGGSVILFSFGSLTVALIVFFSCHLIIHPLTSSTYKQVLIKKKGVFMQI